MVVFAAKNAAGTPQDLNLADVTAAGSPSSAALFTVQGNPSATPIPVALTGTPALATGAATSAKQDTAQANFTSIDSKLPALSGGSVPVVIVGGGGGGGDATAANQATGNTSLASILTAIGTLVTQTVGLATAAAQATMNAALATIAASVPIAVEIQANFARPADVTPYTIGDGVSNSTSAPVALTFANIARAVNGSGYITKARVITDQAANTARFRLHIYNGATAPAAINDNAVQTLLYANRASYVGFIDIGGLSTEGTGSTAASGINNAPRLPFTTNGSSSLYGLLEALDAFTPASNQNFFVALTAEQN